MSESHQNETQKTVKGSTSKASESKPRKGRRPRRVPREQADRPAGNRPVAGRHADELVSAVTPDAPATVSSSPPSAPRPPVQGAAHETDIQDDFGIDIFPIEPPPVVILPPPFSSPVSAAESQSGAEQTDGGEQRRSGRRRGPRGRGRSRGEVDAPVSRDGNGAPAKVASPPRGETVAPAESLERVPGAVGEPSPPVYHRIVPAAEVSRAEPAEAGRSGVPAGNGASPGGQGRRRRRRGRGRGRRNGEAATAQGEPARSAAGTTSSVRPAIEAVDDLAAEDDSETVGTGERSMLINVAEGEECRIAILHRNKLEELFFERASGKSHVGNIYKGRVTNVEPSIQAAFIDFGFPRNGFLHISDLQPQYFPSGMRQAEEVGRKTPRRDRPPIQKCLRRGQEIIVQIIKEGIGTKGPTLTSYISIPGRYLVMMPGMNRLGVSRRIEDEEVRRKMRRVLDELDLPKDMGFILRTAGMDRTKRELQRDLNYLQRLWKVVAKRIMNDRAPCELYQESDLVIRTIRDVYSSDFNKVVVDSEEVARKVADFLAIAMPRATMPVETYSGPLPLFHKYGIEQEIENLYRRQVPLPSGGSLVIDSTEALVAIDVNSGRFREHNDAEETAFRTNMEAAEEIARQLRLRDLGGLILCDLIDMRQDKHIRAVERAVREALRKHKERAKCLRISQFGIMEITRQRMRPSIKRSIYQDCPFCHGSGMVKNAESMALDVIRLLRIAVHQEHVQKVSLRVPSSVAFHLQNHKRETLYRFEKDSGVQVVIHGDRHIGPDQYVIECFDRRGGVVKMMEGPTQGRSETSPHARRQQEGVQRDEVDRLEAIEDVFD